MRKLSRIVVAALCATMGVGCNPKALQDEPAPHAQTVLFERFDTIADGASNAYKVPAGTYRLQMTSTSDGASVAWVGGSCAGSRKTTVFDANCALQQDGQLEIGNPSHLGLGAPISVTLKVIRLP
ncbi:MAG TPA: hypothetical protein VNW92_20900 [Polyangiaceae bacterium]|jgi:hypothetical protein|nr:hypothetical protein [Polyangiaceae bacterium]